MPIVPVWLQIMASLWMSGMMLLRKSCSYDDNMLWLISSSKFDAAVSDPANQYWFQLQPGKMLSA